MSYQYTPLSGGIDYAGTEEPVPDENSSWAEILTVVDVSQATDASESWSHSLHSNTVDSVFARDGVVYSGSQDNTVKAANASDGSEIWSHSLHSGDVWSVFEGDGVVYSGGRDETVKAADASDGSEIWSHSLHSDTVRSVFERDGVVYSGSYDDTVKAVDVPETDVNLRIGFDNKWLPMEGQ